MHGSPNSGSTARVCRDQLTEARTPVAQCPLAQRTGHMTLCLTAIFFLLVQHSFHVNATLRNNGITISEKYALKTKLIQAK